MKPSKSDPAYRPFKNLKVMLEEKAFLLNERNEDDQITAQLEDVESSPEEEKNLFQEAMAGVEQIVRDEPVSVDRNQAAPVKALEQQDHGAEALARLEDLIRNGKGFIISDTPEYVEGIGYGINPVVAKRLHRGDFSIQAHIDLHGFSVESAQEAFDAFLKKAVLSGKRAVSVVHGRGLSSHSEPVLKTKVKEWLTCGHWRKWVIAFTSARACDGGTGATYVLLRQRPATKRHRRQKSIKHSFEP